MPSVDLRIPGFPDPCSFAQVFVHLKKPSSLYRPTSTREDLHLWVGHAGVSCDPGSVVQGAKCRALWRQRSSEGCDVSWLRLLRTRSCVVIGQFYNGSPGAARAVGMPSSSPRSGG